MADSKETTTTVSMTFKLPEGYTLEDFKIKDEDLTNNTELKDEGHHDLIVTGDGTFDKLMEVAAKHLRAQYESNRIRQEDYAAAYIDLYKTTLATVIDAWLKKKLTEAQILQGFKQLEIYEEQLNMYACQAKLYCAQATSEEIKWDLYKAQIEQVKRQTALIDAQEKLYLCQAKFYCTQSDSEEEKKDLYEAQTVLYKAQAQTEARKQALYLRQIEGFDENYKKDILKIMMDSWAVGFSVAKDSFEASGIPSTMQKTTIDDLYNTYVKTDFDKYTYTRTTK